MLTESIKAKMKRKMNALIGAGPEESDMDNAEERNLQPDYMRAINQRMAVYDGAIPYYPSDIERLKIYHCFLASQNFRQLNMFVDNCWNLRSLELMCVVNFRANKYQNPSEFVECLKNLVSGKSRART